MSDAPSPRSPRVIDRDETTWVSNIHALNLEDGRASGRGDYTTISVLEPVMRIERSGERESDGDCQESQSFYRIVTTFTLEISIVGFGQSFQKFNRFFDSVSLRHLFYRGEHVDAYPKADGRTTDIHVTNESGKSNALDAGLTGNPYTSVQPVVNVHAQKDFKLTYHRSMNSWRMGLAYEPYPPTRGKPMAPLGIALWRPKPRRRCQFFQVLSEHKRHCSCRSRNGHSCPLQRRDPYDRAAHWHWQTEASLHLWTPEIYGTFSCPITVVREVDVGVIDGLRRPSDIQQFLHFDFEVSTQLRELGWGWNFFKSSSVPAELRVKTDTGQPLPMDKIGFCLTCCAEMINWPRFQTRNLQAEAEAQALNTGAIPQRLQTNEEYGEFLETQQEDERTSPGFSRSNWAASIKRNTKVGFDQVRMDPSNWRSSLPGVEMFRTTSVPGRGRAGSPSVSAQGRASSLPGGKRHSQSRPGREDVLPAPPSRKRVSLSPVRHWRTFASGRGLGLQPDPSRHDEPSGSEPQAPDLRHYIPDFTDVRWLLG